MSDHEESVGLRSLSVTDDVEGGEFLVHLLYPTDAAPGPVSVGAFLVEAAVDAPFASGDRPLVAISHGSRSSPWVLRGLALGLAARGAIVALPVHPGDNRDDTSATDTDANLQQRPRHLRQTIDATIASAPVRSGGVSAIGHSLGAYTALALAGGRPQSLPPTVSTAQRLALTADVAALAYPLPVEHDRRIETLVLLAPALGFFLADGALAEVTARTYARSAEHDALCPPPMATRALRSLPQSTLLDAADVPGAGHFSFLAPFPPALRRPDFPPSTDPEGFEREPYQQLLLDEVAAFLGLGSGPA